MLKSLENYGGNCQKGRFLEFLVSLNIKNPATVALADELARRQGISKTAAIHQALASLGLWRDRSGASAGRIARHPRKSSTIA